MATIGFLHNFICLGGIFMELRKLMPDLFDGFLWQVYSLSRRLYGGHHV